MDLESINGIGPKTCNILKRLGINNIEDLLYYFPYRYEFIRKMELKDNEKICTDGIIEKNATVFYLRNHKDKMDFLLNTGNKLVKVVIFNRGYLKNKLTVGTKIIVFGKYEEKTNLIVCSDIKFGKLSSNTKIEPIYHVTTGINSSQMNSIINKIDYKIKENIPDYLIKKYNFIEKELAIKEIHNPSNLDILKKSIIRFKYEELFTFMLKINYLKSKKGEKGLTRKVSKDKIDLLINNLPFKLTEDQLKCVDEIYYDLTNYKRMNRLIQGDVGSGKTILSFIALYINYLGGYQGALMAPTEILAIQHFENIKKILPNVKVGLLTGKLKIREKKEIYEKIESGQLDIIIGTHALISENVKYNNLGLVITDEQHRFGVNQRSNLRNKGILADVLYMSATPIPRTYAITLFGDMDISSINTKPTGRKEIISYLKSNKEIKDVLYMMYEQLKLKHQIYVIAPLIDESDKIQLENVIKLQDKMKLAFGKLFTIDIMHGKLSNKEKEEVMSKFKNNEINILISTTVIEVGVDVPNATMMVVFDSFRFGLSALHQLRGRVGRSDLQSYFVMISDQESERLRILTKTSDGFKISEEDFKLRGGGDLFGIKQSGELQFKLADLKKDFNLLMKAKEDSLEFLKLSDKDKYGIYYKLNELKILD